MQWLVVDSLYCAEQRFCSHLDSYSHYLREAGESVEAVALGHDLMNLGDTPEVVMLLDHYELAEVWPKAVKIAQVAAICSPMPWDVRKADGSPAYDAVISSIPWMVEKATKAGCRGVYMPLAFDTRARVCGMGVKRERKAIFIGTTGGNHRRRTEWLEALKDLVEVRPPTFGQAYFRELASASVVLHVHAEWARGYANAMRLFEASGIGCRVVRDGEAHVPGCAPLPGRPVASIDEARAAIQFALDSEVPRQDEALTLLHHTYEHRIPALIELARKCKEAN